MQVTQVILTALVIQTVVGQTRLGSYQRLPETNVIFPNYLLFESRARSKLQCTQLCLNRAGCATFTYTKNSTSFGSCRGHSALQNCSDPQTTRADTKYYGIPSLVKVKPKTAENCQDMWTLQPGSGVRQLKVNGSSLPVSAYCDQDTACGGWTVIQRRQDGSVNFNKTWAQYQAGFGDPAGEYWLGLETIYKMTSTRSYEIRVDVQLYDGRSGYALYPNFSLRPRSDFYRFYVGTMTAGSLPSAVHFHYNNSSRFSAWDVDRDGTSSSNCAARFGGGWWYAGCTYAYLNSPYSYNSTCLFLSDCNLCLQWMNFGTRCYNSLQKTAIKIRPMLK